MRYRSRVVVAFVVLLVGASFAAGAAAAYQRVSKKIVCQCSCNYPLDSCPHTDCGWAPQVRAAIREQVAAGKGEEEILAGLVGQYGEVILAAPPPEGFNLVGWVMPFAALILGLWLVRYVLLTWRRRKPAPVADPALVARYRKAIEKELKNLEER
ncbi:MAG: cytochrome c-type biogenesis protein CcmH [Terriglobia bacterium]